MSILLRLTKMAVPHFVADLAACSRINTDRHWCVFLALCRESHGLLSDVGAATEFNTRIFWLDEAFRGSLTRIVVEI